jgi:hypothetical protein
MQKRIGSKLRLEESKTCCVLNLLEIVARPSGKGTAGSNGSSAGMGNSINKEVEVALGKLDACTAKA